MRNKRHFRGTALCLILLVVFFVLLMARKLTEQKNIDVYSEKYVGVEEIKAELSFGIYEKEEWDAYFSAYHKEYLTGGMLEQLLEKLGVLSYIELPLQEEVLQKRHVVSRAEWNTVYAQILDYLDMEKEVREETFLVLDIMEAEDGIVVISNCGDFYTSLPERYFERWAAYRVYLLGENCVGVAEHDVAAVSVDNAYLKQSSGQSITFLFGGAEYEKEMPEGTDELAAGVCDLVFVDGQLDTVRMKRDTIRGEMLSYDDTTIEIEDYGKIAHQGKIPVYRTYGEVTEMTLADVILGNMEVEYVTGGDEVCAILLLQPASIENIRVLLLADDGTNFRADVYLKADTSASLKCGDYTAEIAAGTPVHATEILAQGGGATCYFTPSGSGRTYICDEQGNPVSNGYYGTMEVRSYTQGYTLVNELSFEAYLYAVVPSEMPSSYEGEALKAQAICARSYAYMQLLRGDLAEYGAHINDSTSYQVYNKTAQTEESIAAVDATHGQVLTYQGNIIEAYYFSTSVGYTDTAAVWNTGDNPAYGYLKAFCLNETEFEGDLSKEDAFLTYLQTPVDGYDSDVRYFRWEVTADYREKTGEINEILAARRAVSEKNVIFYEKDGKTEAESAKDFGKIKSLSVVSRSASGSILTLRITYECGTAEVKTEYNIRKVLGCGASKIVYADRSEGSVSELLPSAYCTVTPQEDGTYLLYGGGYGHGLGMSQNGANGMAKAGMSCEEILNCFYNGVEIENMDEL